MTTKKTVTGALAMVVAIGFLAGAVAAQVPPGNAGPPEDVTTGPPGDAGPPEDVTTGPPEGAGPSKNVTRGPSENVTVGPPDGAAEFASTSPLGPGQADPNSLSGKIRVESHHLENTTVELLNDTAVNTTLDITVTGNATNVTFYLQKQAVEASQGIENVTMAVDGEPAEFGLGGNGANWITFEIAHFSTRTVKFTSAGAKDSGDPNAPDSGEKNSAGEFSEGNPLVDENNSPFGVGKAADVLFEWNRNDGVVDGVEVPAGDMADFLFEWNTVSE